MYIYIYIYDLNTVQETQTQRSENKQSYWGQCVSHMFVVF